MVKVTKILVFAASLLLGMHNSIIHVIADEANETTVNNNTTASTTTTATTTTTTAATTAAVTTTATDDSDTTSNDDKELSLENMSNEELETICTSRGFEIVKEVDESGNERKFSREEYIDAATQCLEIEAEM